MRFVGEWMRERAEVVSPTEGTREKDDVGTS